ncbi:MAG: crossover junction endodeoxyribonuclease RuvC [Candidatus Dojkabacteria bacterium]|jgi:crossover junction endodeoxyribonuclease RuvC
MRILGIDPGLAIVGWSVVDFDKKGNHSAVDFGAILTKKDMSVGERLQEIYDDLNHIVDKFKPDCCGLETLLFYNNARTAMVVGEARGIVRLVLQRANIPVYEFTPLQVKSSISGYGRAPKKQVQENVKLFFNLDEIPKPDDVADALALAVACFDRLKMDRFL